MPTLAIGNFSFENDNKFTAEVQQQIKDLAFESNFSITTNPDGDYIWGDITMLVEDACKFGKFSVKKILPYHILNRISDFGTRQTASAVNEICKVSVAGLGLLTVDTVKLRTDHCTDALQEDLDNGWKIIAICVQPDQRRPDYILGKTTKLE